MTSRRIQGASGDLYDHDSNAHHLALKLLARRLSAIGFAVRKKPDRETTLRVYPRKMLQYPLLNPRFRRAESNDFEVLEITVWSKGDHRALHRYLKTYAGLFYAADDFDPTRKPEALLCHGWFILPVGFKADEIDFAGLDEQLRDLWQFLNALPASKSKMLV